MSRASSLYRLQSVDLDLDRSRVRMAEIEVTLQDSEAVVRVRGAVAAAEAALQAARTAVKSAEQTVAAHLAKLAESEKALYGGGVRNPKELQDLQSEVESLRRHRQTLEDRLLDAMVIVEEAELERDAVRQELSRVENIQADRNAALDAERRELLARCEGLEIEREAALASVPQEDFQAYTQLRETRGSVAVALLQDDSCAACGLTQSASFRQVVRAGTELARCPQCGRILYAG
jgi:hypothetical protein